MAGAYMYAFLWVLLYGFRRFWWRWSIEGLEHLPPRDQGMLIAVNHIDWIDIPIIGGSLPYSHRLSWMAKAELFGHPLTEWFFRTMQCIPIRRGKRDVAALYASQEALQRGAVLLMFPEGHRSGTGQLQEGRNGAIRLAVRTGCPIVPVAVWGTESGFRGAMLRKPIHLRVGAPYHPAPQGTHLSAARLEELTGDMMTRIAALLPEQYRGVYHDRVLAEVAL
ncbi:MAG TPA: lysophospholipid acyltransferase family protein [Roseiflexaceae bacterium]|nr:lysophospholipid acyltransferase family protein [Roseiflexaceae bacterium]